MSISFYIFALDQTTLSCTLKGCQYLVWLLASFMTRADTYKSVVVCHLDYMPQT